VTPDQLVAVAAIVQAISAVFIGGLTLFLVLSARQSNRELARSRYLAAVPFINVHAPVVEFGDTGTTRYATTRLTITNGTVTALDVRIQLIGDVVKGRLPRHEAGINHLAALAPSQQLTIQPETGGLRDEALWNRRNQAESGYNRAFMYDVIEAHVWCSGILGATVYEVYEWAPNPDKMFGVIEWRIRELHISGPGIETIDHRYPDDDERWQADLAEALDAAIRKK